MSRLDERISRAFHQWERRGRGYLVFPEPVAPEPPFEPPRPRYFHEEPIGDDGYHETFLNSLVRRFSRKLAGAPDPPAKVEPAEEPQPETLYRGSIVEFQFSLPREFDCSKDSIDYFLATLVHCAEPIAFEILSSRGRVTAQFAVAEHDVSLMEQQLNAHFPGAIFHRRADRLRDVWDGVEGQEFIIEFGLGSEFVLPLASCKIDPFVGIVGALSHLEESDLGLFQVIFQPVSNPWSESILEAVTQFDGMPLFVNAPELAKAAENKVSKRLYAAVVRVATKAPTFNRAIEIARDVSCALTVFAHPTGNELVPLSNRDYPSEVHVEDTLVRQSRRTGMILNRDELIGFVHLPTSVIQSQAFVRQVGKTKAAPAVARDADGIFIGHNVHQEESVPVHLTSEHRVRHTHIIGASGTGKSSLLLNLITQDMENGAGIAVLDPHGELIDRILAVVPDERIDDVVLVDPSDDQYAVGFNILSAHTELEKTLLASDLVSVFHRLSSSWGDQLHSVMQNAILALLESSRPGTLYDLRRFLIEPPFRAEFLKSVSKPNVLYYWQKAFPHLSGNKSIGPVVTRLDDFFSKEPILHMVAQPENKLDFAKIMDSGKIFLAKIPEGSLGRENTHLLGTLLISRFQQAAMSRQMQKLEARRDFWIYIDEFADFVTPSMAKILSGARKYRIGLTLAHHELQQLHTDAEVESAVLSHPCTRICFKLGDQDARKMAEGFSFFEAHDLQNLGIGEAVARIERSDFDFNLTVPLPEEIDPEKAAAKRQAIIEASRAKYGTLRSSVEAALLDSLVAEPPPPKKSRVSPPPAPSPAPLLEPVQQEPKPAELPNVTVSEKKTPVALSSVPIATPVSSQPSLPRDQGKGGAQHKAIQKRIKAAAEELGFKSTIEKPVPGHGLKGIDLYLERDGQAIACEISLTTSIDHEVRNVVKCLEAEIPSVAIICLNEERLKKIAAAVSGSLGKELAARVGYYQPDQFIAILQKLPVPKPKKPNEVVRRGYKVKHSLSDGVPEEQAAKEQLAIDAIAAAMRKKSRKSGR